MAYIVDPTVTPPTAPATTTSTDGILTVTLDPDNAGVYLHADFSSVPDVTKVRFFREDGTPVRSGDPAPAISGVATAYDLEAPVGSVTGWYAIPIGPGLPDLVDSPDVQSSNLAISIPSKVGPQQHTYESWPLLVATPTSWLLTYQSSDGHVVADGRETVVQRSLDEGLTWTITHIFEAVGENWGGGQFSVTADGALALSTKRTVGETEELVFWRSVDDGLTWVEQNRYSGVGWDDVATLGTMLLLQSGDLLASYHGNGWGMARSIDNGVTWTIEGTTNGGPWMREGRIIQADDGTLIGFGRNGSLDIFYSYDSGHTWTQGTDTGIVADTGGNSNTEGIIRNGDRLQLIFISRASFKMFYTETTFDAVLSSPGAWSPAVELAEVPAGEDRGADIGYPSMLYRADGRMVVAWYQDPEGTATPSIFTATMFDLAVENDPDANASDIGALFVPTTDEPWFVWVKSVTDPNLQVLARVWGEAPDESYAPRRQLADVYGSRYPAVSHDVHSASTQAWTFWCQDHDEFLQLEEILLSGELLINPDPATNIRPFYALPGEITRQRTDTHNVDDCLVSVSAFTEVERPPTTDTPLIIPGHSILDFFAATQTIDNAEVVYPTILSSIGL